MEQTQEQKLTPKDLLKLREAQEQAELMKLDKTTEDEDNDDDDSEDEEDEGVDIDFPRESATDLL